MCTSKLTAGSRPRPRHVVRTVSLLKVPNASILALLKETVNREDVGLRRDIDGEQPVARSLVCASRRLKGRPSPLELLVLMNSPLENEPIRRVAGSHNRLSHDAESHPAGAYVCVDYLETAQPGCV